MRWLIHGNTATAVRDALVRHGHTALTPGEADVDAEAGPIETLEIAQKKQLDLLTADKDLIDAAFGHGFAFNRSIVFLQLPGGDVEQDDAVDRLFQRYKRLTPGRLYTVTENRVKIRQLPGPR